MDSCRKAILCFGIVFALFDQVLRRTHAVYLVKLAIKRTDALESVSVCEVDNVAVDCQSLRNLTQADFVEIGTEGTVHIFVKEF